LFDDAVSLQNMLIDCTAAILLTLLNFKVRRVLRWSGVGMLRNGAMLAYFKGTVQHLLEWLKKTVKILVKLSPIYWPWCHRGASRMRRVGTDHLAATFGKD